MSLQQLKTFNQRLEGDQALQIQLAGAKNREDFAELAVEMGRKVGFSFTADEMLQEINLQETRNNAESWISDELLDSVAGYQAHGSETGTCTCQGCNTWHTEGCHTGDDCSCLF